MTHWYTADTHFGHEAIIRFCDRPFHNTQEMDRQIIENMKSLVKADDDLWIIGDFAYGPASKAPGYAEKIFKALPGRKHLVVGNHDDERTKKLPWASVQDMAVFDDEGRRVVLCHYPMMTWDGARRGALQLFGHVHKNWEGAYHCVNVGVDLWGYAPTRLEASAHKAERLPRNSYWDVVEPRL